MNSVRVKTMKDSKIVNVRFMKDGRNICLASGTLLPKGINIIHQRFYDLPLSRVKEIARTINCKYRIAYTKGA